MKRWRAILPLLLVLACEQRPAPQSLYERAEQLRRSGDLQQALRLAQQGLAAAPREADPWHWKFRLLTAGVHLSRGETREALAKLDGTSGPADPQLRARWLMHLGEARIWLADLPAARELLDQAYALAVQSGAAELLVQIELLRAIPPRGFAPAEAHYRAARELASQRKDPYWLAAAESGMGFIRLKYGRYDEAIPWFQTARQAAEQCGARRLVSNVLGNLGTCYSNLGDFDRAFLLLQQAGETAAQTGDKRNQQIWLANLARVLRERGELDQAQKYYERAAALARERDDLERLATVLNDLAELSLAQSQTAEAKSFHQEALAIRRRLQNPRLLVYSELTGGRIARAEGRLAEAEGQFRKLAQAAGEVQEPRAGWEAQAELAALDRAAKKWDAAQEEYRAALATIDAEWAKLSRDESKITFLAKLIGFYQDYVDFLMEQGQAAAALEAADRARGRVLEQRLGVRRRDRGAGGFSAWRDSLKSTHTVVLAYWLAPRRGFLWVLSRSGLAHFELPPEREIAEMVTQYNRLIQDRRDPVEREYPVRTRLYQTLLGPAAAAIRPGDRVILVPDGRLHELNFETLVVETPRPHYWIEDVQVSIAPSLEVLRFEPRRAVTHPNLLFIGDPQPPAKEYPALPHLAEELEIVRRSFPERARKIYAGEQANPETYRQARPQDFFAIHFAAHAVANAESALNSAVVLSPKGEGYKLYARDVLDVPIRAELVTVSACRSAGAKSYSGEGLLGFAWAFLEAGARRVIAGLWDVDDAATSRLMGRLYQQVAAGAPAGEALRRAKLELLRSGSVYRKPYFWGPFQVFTRFAEGPAAPLTRLSRRSTWPGERAAGSRGRRPWNRFPKD